MLIFKDERGSGRFLKDKMKQVILVSVLVSSLFMGGCSSIQNSISLNSLNFTNSSATVECFSGGKTIYKTQTKGKVTDSPASDGFFFTDSEGKFVEINADCIVTD